ncbi:MAG: hypothetical protein ACM3UZ_13920 [Acidobacteriota bacterium]
MRRLWVVLIAVLLLSGCAGPAANQGGQQNTGDWQRSYAGASGWRIGYSVTETSSSNFVIAGKQINASNDSATNSIFMTNADANGRAQWAINSLKDDKGVSEYAFYVAASNDGGINFLSRKQGNGTTTAETTACFMDQQHSMKFNEVLDAKRVLNEFSRIQSLNDGGYLAVAFDSGGIMNNDGGQPILTMDQAYLVNYDSRWNKIWEVPLAKSASNSANYRVSSLVQTRDKGYLLLASAVEEMIDVPASLVMKYDNKGACLWSRAAEKAKDIVPATDNNGFVLLGSGINDTTDEQVMQVSSFDNMGKKQWCRTFPGVTNGFRIIAGKSGGYIITGTTAVSSGTDIYAVILDSLGNRLWDKKSQVSKVGCPFQIIQTRAGAIVIAANQGKVSTGSNLWDTETEGDVVLIKFELPGSPKPADLI